MHLALLVILIKKKSFFFLANPFGVVIGSAIPALFVDKNSNIGNTFQIFYLVNLKIKFNFFLNNFVLFKNLALMILAFIVVLMASAIRSSHPPTPSSASSNYTNKPLFFEGLLLLFK